MTGRKGAMTWAKKPAPKPAAPLASALRALRRYEPKVENPPSEPDRQALGEIAETARRLLEGR